MIAPFAVSLFLGGLLRVAGGQRHGPVLMGLAIVCGVLAAFLLTGTASAFPPAAALGKAFYLVLAAAGLGLLIDLEPRARPLEELGLLILPPAALIWIAWPKIWAGPGFLEVLTWLVAWIAGTVWLFRFKATAGQAGSLAGSLMLGLAGAGAAGAALIADSVTFALFAAAVAASALGFALWRLAALVLLGSPGSFGATPLFGGAGALLVMVDLMIVQAPRVSLWALLVLVLLPFVLLPFKRLLVFDTTASRLITAFLVSVLGGGVAAAAVGIAFLSVTS